MHAEAERKHAAQVAAWEESVADMKRQVGPAGGRSHNQQWRE